MTRVERVLKRLGIDAKKRGREWTALCPNKRHADRTPSWRIVDAPGTKKDGWHNCYPCSFGGTLLDLAEHVLGVPREEARVWLKGEEDTSPLPGSTRLEVRDRRPLRRSDPVRDPPGVCWDPFERWPASARDYVLSRGIDDWQVKCWGIGYALSGRLAGRIVFPYRDARGDLRGYTARTFTGQLKRYLEPHPKEGADTGVMFGEARWVRKEIRHTVAVVEGAVNALAVEKATSFCVAAIAGSNPLADARVGEYVRKLSTWKLVLLLTDPDAAGEKAAKALEGALARHAKTLRVRLPEGTDAADLGRPALRQRIIDALGDNGRGDSLGVRSVQG